ncbi:MAG: hypothetical protein HY258_01015 [Chloroflexi bacterium]|nr:hypothetical protein [Chloroflexota bacterium]
MLYKIIPLIGISILAVSACTPAPALASVTPEETLALEVPLTPTAGAELTPTPETFLDPLDSTTWGANNAYENPASTLAQKQELSKKLIAGWQKELGQPVKELTTDTQRMDLFRSLIDYTTKNHIQHLDGIPFDLLWAAMNADTNPAGVVPLHNGDIVPGVFYGPGADLEYWKNRPPYGINGQPGATTDITRTYNRNALNRNPQMDIFSKTEKSLISFQFSAQGVLVPVTIDIPGSPNKDGRQLVVLKIPDVSTADGGTGKTQLMLAEVDPTPTHLPASTEYCDTVTTVTLCIPGAIEAMKKEILVPDSVLFSPTTVLENKFKPKAAVTLTVEELNQLIKENPQGIYVEMGFKRYTRDHLAVVWAIIIYVPPPAVSSPTVNP